MVIHGMHSKKFFLFLFLLNSINALAFDEGLHIADLAVVNDCRAIEGSYLPVGFSQSNVPLSKKYKYPRIEWGLFGAKAEAVEKQIKYVSISLSEDMQFNVNAYDLDNNLSLSKNYGNGSIACVNGWWITGNHSKGGSGETGMIESHTRTAYARAENSYLIVRFTQKDIRKTFFFFKSERNFEIWTVYKPK